VDASALSLQQKLRAGHIRRCISRLLGLGRNGKIVVSMLGAAVLLSIAIKSSFDPR
jgi:hypothetical protein